MEKLTLRKIKSSDKKYFSAWWRDKELIKLTSGVLTPISDKGIEKNFLKIKESKNDLHYLILIDKGVIGHVSLIKRRSGWWETQIVIGEKEYQNKGLGTMAIKALLKRTKRLGVSKTFLEVRPTNKRAVRTYEKCGFNRVGVKKYLRNKHPPETLRMELVESRL